MYNLNITPFFPWLNILYGYTTTFPIAENFCINRFLYVLKPIFFYIKKNFIQKIFKSDMRIFLSSQKSGFISLWYDRRLGKWETQKYKKRNQPFKAGPSKSINTSYIFDVLLTIAFSWCYPKTINCLCLLLSFSLPVPPTPAG